jgi:hypothetical protein
MRLIITSYIEQNTKQPKIGRYILTQFDVIVSKKNAR